MKKVYWKSYARTLTALCTACTLAGSAIGQSYQVTDLGSLDGFGSFTQPFGINNGGQVVGASLTSSGINDSFLWTPAVPNGLTGSILDLGQLSTASLGNQANAINDAGVAVGFSGTQDGSTHAFSFSQGVLTDLGVLPNYSFSQATAINTSGQIVG